MPSSLCMQLQAPALTGRTSLLPHVPQQCYFHFQCSDLAPTHFSISIFPDTESCLLRCWVSSAGHSSYPSIPSCSPSLPPLFPITRLSAPFLSTLPSLMIWTAVLTPSSSETDARFSALLYSTLSRNPLPNTLLLPLEKNNSPRLT